MCSGKAYFNFLRRRRNSTNVSAVVMQTTLANKTCKLNIPVSMIFALLG
jgi:hypothetical protein